MRISDSHTGTFKLQIPDSNVFSSVFLETWSFLGATDRVFRCPLGRSTRGCNLRQIKEVPIFWKIFFFLEISIIRKWFE